MTTPATTLSPDAVPSLLPTDSALRTALVAGDVIWDHHIYEGVRIKPWHTDARAAVPLSPQTGGALALAELIKLVLEKEKEGKWDTLSAVGKPAEDAQYSLAIWGPFPRNRQPKEAASKAKMWRITKLLGYGDRGRIVLPCKQDGAPAQSDLLILDDAGFKFRLLQQRECWHLTTADTGWILLKMSEPVARGDLWHALAEGRAHDKLVCVMSAQDLRREAVAIRRGLSWEQTVEEVHEALRDHPILRQMQHCRHLVIVFSADGALWVKHVWDGNKLIGSEATLVYDSGGYENCGSEQQDGRVVGSMMVMTAALAQGIARHITTPGNGSDVDLKPSLRSGLSAMRILQRYGHGIVGEKAPNGFPTAHIAKAIVRGPKGFAHARVPWPERGLLPKLWTIAESSEHPEALRPPLGTVGLARALAIYGEVMLKEIPHGRFGKLLTVDRSEIEALRNIRRSMQDYAASPGKKPFSIGVFGPPGAGKSFGVRELSDDLFGSESWREFNLSQFTDERDLRGAFHQVRDIVLAAVTPVVFWDEFDSGNYRWLRHLLAPMQDGRFQDGQLNHAVGKAIFVFAGGTSERYADFGPNPGDPELQAEFRLLKGPDFISRLDAYYDVAGPNQRKRRVSSPSRARALARGAGQAPRKRPADLADQFEPDPADVAFPLRRALLLRHHLASSEKQELDFDSDLLDALLLVPSYRHGSRSLEKLVRPLRPVSGNVIRRSALPSRDLIRMHVDDTEFHRALLRLNGFRSPQVVDRIAAAGHAEWLAAEPNPLPQLNKPFEQLAEVDKHHNRAAARRIPEVLALAGLTIHQGSAGLTEKEFDQQVLHRLERLARAEHDGWVSQRLADGWTPVNTRQQRDYNTRQHDTLKPYMELDDTYKEKDRAAVRSIWRRVRAQGYSVIWLSA